MQGATQKRWKYIVLSARPLNSGSEKCRGMGVGFSQIHELTSLYSSNTTLRWAKLLAAMIMLNLKSWQTIFIGQRVQWSFFEAHTVTLLV